MNCREASISLQLAEDGEIASGEREALLIHLSECLACRRMAAWLDALRESYPLAETVDDDFADQVVRRIRRENLGAAREPDSEAELLPEKRPPKRNRRWLGRIWSLLSGRRRKQRGQEEGPGWPSRVAGSMTIGLKSLRPAMAPAVAGQTYATGWLRIAGSNLRAMARLGA
jgi:hypothetical protein